MKLSLWLRMHNYPLIALEWIQDYRHCRAGKPPLWPDAEPCGKRYCRFCGGTGRRYERGGDE